MIIGNLSLLPDKISESSCASREADSDDGPKTLETADLHESLAGKVAETINQRQVPHGGRKTARGCRGQGPTLLWGGQGNHFGRSLGLSSPLKFLPLDGRQTS